MSNSLRALNNNAAFNRVRFDHAYGKVTRMLRESEILDALTFALRLKQQLAMAVVMTSGPEHLGRMVTYHGACARRVLQDKGMRELLMGISVNGGEPPYRLVHLRGDKTLFALNWMCEHCGTLLQEPALPDAESPF